MKSYLLFIYGVFDDHEDVEFFCTEVFGKTPKLLSITYIIETNTSNIIIIFDSDYDTKTLSNELFHILKNENIKFYFIFQRDSLVSAHLPPQVKDIIFKPRASDETIMTIDFNDDKEHIMDLDELLEKIEKTGVQSLTPEEKNFLDNFEK
jgi:hypothetical protein